MSIMDRQITILYGSETGNAQDLSESLCSTLQRHHFEVQLSSLDSFPLTSLLDIQYLIIISSTTGQGEFPFNALKFWKFLARKKLPSNLLTHLKFTTFGLGDSSYPRFNWAIKKLHSRMLQLGAKEFSKRAEADELGPNGGIDGYYSEFEKLLLENLIKAMPLPEGMEVLDETVLFPAKNEVLIGRTSTNEEKDIKHELDVATVVSNTRITSTDHFQDTRQLILRLPEHQDYSPGDTVSLYPKNSANAVNALIQILKYDNIADEQISLCPFPEGLRTTCDGKMTLRQLITDHLDINSIPRRSFFSLLAKFAGDEREREKLQDFTNFANAEELYDYANRPRRSILEVLQEFDSVVVPLGYLFDLIPAIKPRLFSISSGDTEPNRGIVELTIALVEYQTKIKRIRRGLCSTFVKSLKAGDSVYYKLSTGKISIPHSQRKPMIMISPGTGLAPMKNLIESYIHTKSYNSSQLYLFFGNRYHNKDYYYQSELESYVKGNQLTLFTSFSREGQGYVQDKLYVESKLIAELLTDKNAIVFVCGSSGSMPVQVRITLESILKEEKGLGDEEAKLYLEELEQAGRYFQETW